MKKLLTLAAAGLLGLGAYAQTDAAIDLSSVFVAEDRAGWTISGCAEHNGGGDGGFNEIKDGATNTHWHSTYTSVTGHNRTSPHYFVVDRGEANANGSIDGFGYMPRQGNPNGRATAWRVFVLDNINGLNTTGPSTTEGHIADNHESLTSFVAGKTPAARGTFSYAGNNDNDVKRVLFESPQTGRYVLFVADAATTDNDATCAEFYLYDINPEVATRVTLTFKRDNADANPLVKQSVAMLSQSFPEYGGFKCVTTSTVSNDNTAAEYVMNEATTSFYLFNQRRSKYVSVNAAGNALAQEAVENPGEEALFKMIPMGSDNGFAIYHPATDKFVGNIAGSTTPVVDFTATPQKYYTGRQDAPITYMSWIGTNSNKSGNNFFNDFGGYGTSVGGYSWNNDGSQWVVVTNLAQFKENWQLRNDLLASLSNYEAMLAVLGEEDTEGLQAWAENYDFGGDVNVAVTAENQEKIDKIKHITLRADIEFAKRRGNKLASLDFITEAGKAAWNASLSQLEGADASEATLTSLNDAITTLGKATMDTYLKFQSGKPTCAGDYLGADIGYGNALYPAPRRWAGGADCRIWKLCSANGVGFYLFNEYTNKYMKHPAAGGYATFVSDVADASVYLIDVYDHENAMYGLRTFDEGVPADGAYLLSDGVNELQRGTAKNVSSWYISTVTEDEAANEHLAGAKSFYNNCNPKGTALGEYTVADPAAAEEALNVGNGATPEEKRTAAAALFAITPGGAGHFYRIQGIGNSKYMSTTETGNRIDMVEDAAGNHEETVWYFDGTKLVSFSTGKALSVCTSTHYNSVVPGEGSLVGTVVFEEATTAGKYLLKVTNTTESDRTRYIYNLSNQLDGGRDHPGNNAGYHWTISQVGWLPIPGSDQAYTTLTSPVALKLREHVTAYTANVSENGKVVLSAIDGNVIPANTPLVLHFAAGVERNTATGLVYLEIAGEGTAITSDLKGSYLATAKDATKQYAVLNGTKFTALEDDNVPGFKAHIEVSDANDHALTTAAIENILTPGKVFSIKNEDTRNNRGYLVYNNEQTCIWTTGDNKGNIADADATAASVNDINYHWTVVSDNAGKYYLYNLGAQKFAAAFMQPGSSNAGNAEFSWSFSDTPTAIEIQSIDWVPTANIFQIVGGQNASNTSRPAGMVVINGNTYPVAGISGVNAKDGNGFIFTEVTGATAADVPTAETVEAVKAEMVEEYNTAKTNVDGWDETVAGSGVGYFTAEGFTAYSNAISAVDETADAEAKHYAVVRAKIAVDGIANNVNTFAADAVYNVTNADGQYYKATITKNEDNTYTTSAVADDLFATDKIEYNWLSAVGEAGTVTLTHSFQVAAAAAPVSRAAENYTTIDCHLVENATPAYDGFGNVTLGENMVVKATNRAEKPETTAIEELSLDSKAGADVIYDLQGRRVSKATHGVYIVDGKKIYVK